MRGSVRPAGRSCDGDDLSTTRGELSTTRGELSTTEDTGDTEDKF
jgi:hypothetical protein